MERPQAITQSHLGFDPARDARARSSQPPRRRDRSARLVMIAQCRGWSAWDAASIATGAGRFDSSCRDRDDARRERRCCFSRRPAHAEAALLRSTRSDARWVIGGFRWLLGFELRTGLTLLLLRSCVSPLLWARLAPPRLSPRRVTTVTRRRRRSGRKRRGMDERGHTTATRETEGGTARDERMDAIRPAWPASHTADTRRQLIHIHLNAETLKYRFNLTGRTREN